MKQGIIILLLLCVALFLVLKNFEIWDTSYEKGPEKEPVKKVEKKTEPAPPSPPGQPERPSPPASISIADKNIFNPERKDFPSPMTPEGMKKPGTRPQMTLYGVVVGEDYQFASVAITGKPPQKGERGGGEARTLKVGENIGEYKLAKILPDRIVMEAPEDTFEVLLHDQTVAKGRAHVRTENKPAMITSVTPTPATGVPPTPAPGVTPAPVTSPIPTTIPTGSRVPAPPAPASSRRQREPASPGPFSPTRPAAPASPAKP
jgi:hypothetical protein